MTSAMQLKLRVQRETADSLSKLKKDICVIRRKILPTSGSQLVRMGGKESDRGKRMKERLPKTTLNLPISSYRYRSVLLC